MNHPFILSLVHTYMDETYLYMLLELVQGGELFCLLDRSGPGPAPGHAHARGR